MTTFIDAFFACDAGQHDDYTLYVCDLRCPNAVVIGVDGEDTIVRARLDPGNEGHFLSCPEYVAASYADLFEIRPHLDGQVMVIIETDDVCYIDRVMRMKWCE